MELSRQEWWILNDIHKGGGKCRVDELPMTRDRFDVAYLIATERLSFKKLGDVLIMTNKGERELELYRQDYAPDGGKRP